MNDSRMYFLSGATNSETWSMIDGMWPLYLQTDTNTAVFGGNITSPRFRSIKPVNNVTNLFTNDSVTLVTIASNIPCYGGTLIFHCEVGGYASSSGLKSYTIRYTNYSGQIKASIPLSFYFNQTSVHHAWSRTHVQTGVPTANMKIELVRNTTTLKCDQNDFINVTIQEMPY
jgi:hypothetical protein